MRNDWRNILDAANWFEWTPPSTCFEPTTLAIGGMVANAGGSLLSGMGQSKQYGAAADEARYKAQVAENNAAIARQNARYAAQAGRIDAQTQDFQTAAAMGRARAATGASGLDVTTGSPADVRESIRQVGRFSSLEKVQEAALKGYGYETQAADYIASSQLERSRAASAQRAGSTAMFGSLLGAAGGVSDKWLRYKNVGIFGDGGSSEDQDFSSGGFR